MEVKVNTKEKSAVYVNVKTDFIKKGSANKSDRDMTSEDLDNDVCPDHDKPPRGSLSEYEDVEPTEDEHTYETAIQKSGKSDPETLPADDSQIYENLSINGENETSNNSCATIIDKEENNSKNGQNQSDINITEDSQSHIDINEEDDPHIGINEQDATYIGINETDESHIGIHVPDESHIDISETDNSHIGGSETDNSNFGINKIDELHLDINKWDESNVSANKEGDTQEVGDSLQKEMHRVDDDLQNSSKPADWQIQDSYLESISNESFLVPGKPTLSGEEVIKTKVEISEQNVTQEAQCFDKESLEDVEEKLKDQSTAVHAGNHGDDLESVNAPFEIDGKLDTFAPSISDSDVKSFDSTSTFVTHGQMSIEELSDSFEVVSREFSLGSIEDSNGEKNGSTSVDTDVAVIENLSKNYSDIKENNEQIPSLIQTTKPEVNISFQDSSNSEISGERDEAQNEVLSSERTGERRESETRKIALDHGEISFDDSSISSASGASDIEDKRPTVIRQESVTLDIPTFDSADLKSALSSMPGQTLDDPEQLYDLGRRTSVTLDYPIFKKDSDINPEQEVSPLDSFQVIEAEPLEQPNREESDVDDKSPIQQRKVLKINMSIDDDADDSDEASDDSETRSSNNSNSDLDSSTEA
jgi:hypothetical protein